MKLGRSSLAATAAFTLAAATAVTALAGPAAAAPSSSAAELRAASDAIAQDADIKGTAWGVDPATDTLRVTADASVDAAEMAELKKVAAEHDGAVDIERTDGVFRKYISGGDAIYAGGGRCSLGFNVRAGSTYYFLTAGHCTINGPTWTAADGTVLGSTEGTGFPADDYGIVRYTNDSVAKPGTVGSQDITQAGNAYVGQNVTRRGSTTGLDSGRVTGLNQTVNYGGGDIVEGLIRTDVCAEPGDSGGPLYSGSTALGLTSGGSGDCTSGGTTFFQPVVEVLNAYGVSVY